MRRATIAALATLAACGAPAGPTPEELAREGLLRQRAEAAQRGATECRAACDASLARLAAGAPVEAAGVGRAREICAEAGIR